MKLSLTFVVLGLMLLPSASAFARNLPQGFNPARWNQLIQRIFHEGTPSDTGIGRYMTLTRVNPPKTVPSYLLSHQVEMISTIDGQAVEAVAQQWNLDHQSHWHIDQWIFSAAIQGDLIDAQHDLLIEDSYGKVLQDKMIPTGGPTNTAVLTGWGKFIQGWYSR